MLLQLLKLCCSLISRRSSTRKKRRELKRSKMSFSSKSEVYEPRDLIFNKSINKTFWLEKIPRKRIIAGTRPIIIKKVTKSKEKKIFLKNQYVFPLTTWSKVWENRLYVTVCAFIHLGLGTLLYSWTWQAFN